MMKKYLLALHNLKYMLKKGNHVFFIVLISMSLSVFGMLFFSGYFLYSYYEAEMGSKIDITLHPGIPGTDVLQLLSQLKEKNYVTQQVQMTAGETDDSGVTGEYNRQWNKSVLDGKNYTLDEEHPYVIMAEYMVDFMKNGESPVGFHLKDQEALQVYGIVSYTENDGYCVPVRYYALHYPTETVRYCYAQKLDKKTVYAINTTLKNSSAVADYHIVRTANPFLSADFMEKFVQIVLIFSVIIINIFCMTYSWIIHFKRDYRIYAVCGADKKSIVGIIMVQTIILMFAGVFAGNILFFIGKTGLKHTTLVYQKSYVPYLEISLLLMMILTVFSWFLAKKVTQTNTIYRGSE